MKAQRRETTLRWRVLAAVIALMILLPLVIFFSAWLMNRDLLARLQDAELARSLDYARRLCQEVEPRLGEGGLPLSSALAGLEQRIRIENEMVQYVRLLDEQGRLLAEVTRREDIQPAPSPPHLLLSRTAPAEELVRQIKAESSGLVAFYAVTFPLRLPSKLTGRFQVGLSPELTLERLRQGLIQNNLRALRAALIGTAVLALLAAYIAFLNDQTRTLQKRLEKERHLATIGTLASGLAHEIRNPLNAMVMNIQMIEDRLAKLGDAIPDGEGSPEREDTPVVSPDLDLTYVTTKMARIRQETERLEKSVRDFLQFARPPAPERRTVDLHALIDEAVELMTPRLEEEGVRLERDYASDLPPLSVDPGQMKQVVENLVLNAEQAVTGGSGRGSMITLATRVERHAVKFSVSDTGGGIADEHRDRIFEAFYTTKEGGTGLGLNIVTQIVRAHGGRLAAERTGPDGTTMTATLPRRR